MKINNKQLATFITFIQTHAIVTNSVEREMLAEVGLRNTWFEVLAYLNGSPKRKMRMRDLAQMIALTRSGVTRLMDRLEKAGFTKREPYPGDRRGIYTVITPKGRAELRRCVPSNLTKIGEHFFRYLDDNDVEALYKILSKVLYGEIGVKQGKLLSAFLSKILEMKETSKKFED